jgi:hypothetical protein
MKKLRDFVCTNFASCTEAGVKTERLARDGEAPLCKTCNQAMSLVASFPTVPTHVSWSKWRI